MDFFGSLNEVRKNSNQLNAWENQQRDKDAQRKAYQAKHAPTPEEIERAKQLGETLINVIDVMDDHSESVAENVETATAGISTLTMLAGGGAAAYLAWNLGIKPANKAEKEAIKAFDEDKKTQALIEKLNNNTKIRKPNGEVIDDYKFDPYDLRSGWGKQRLEQITDANIKHEAMEMTKVFEKTMKPIKRKFWLGAISIPVAGLVSWFLGNVYETKLQVDSSRIARFQARRELRDPKAFVNYTPEQIAKAKAELDKHPEKIKKAKKDNLKKGFFSSIRELLRDRDNYNKTKKLRAQQQTAVDRPLSDAEILQAKKDQEVIQRVVKHINNEAEKNSEKMEVAASVIMNTFPVVGTAIGFAITLGLDKTGLIKKWVGNFVEKNGSEDAKAAFKELAKLKKDDPKYTSAWKEFYGELTGIPQNQKQWKKYYNKKYINKPDAVGAVETKAKKVNSNFERILEKGKKVFSGLMVHKTRGKWLIGLGAGVLAAFPSALIALKLQKDASRAGRFTAKRELEQDPTNFIGYSDTELNEVKEVKNQKEKGSKFKEYALFIPNIIRDWWKYNKYRNNEMKEKKALHNELKKLDVSEKQLRDAKNLQAKVFNTFDRVDDKSQSYSEATEAAIETMQPLVYAAGALAMISPLIYFGIQSSRGKYTPGKIAAKITGAIAASSAILKSKLFKGYLKGVEKHTANVVNNIDTEKSYLGVMLKDIDLLETPLIDIPFKSLSNLKSHISKTLRGMDEQAQVEELWKIQDELFKPLVNKNSSTAKEDQEFIDKIFSRLRKYYKFEWDGTGSYIERNMSPAQRADVVDLLLLNKERISKMTPEEFNNAKGFLTDIIRPESADVDKLAKLLTKLQEKVMNKISDNPILGSNPEIEQALGKVLQGSDIEQGINSIFKGIDKISQDDCVKLIDGLGEITKDLNGEKVPFKLKDVPGVVEKFKNIAKGASSAAELAGVKAEGNLNINILLSPKEGLSSLAKAMEKMEDATYIEFVSKTPMRGWEKESVIKVVQNVAKMWENIPKEESKRIFSALLKQFNENPDKFVEAVKTGKIMSMFATPQVKTALAAAGISWTIFTAVVTYAIESWLAEIQLRAGRLGVKKAMDELQDHRYYANVIPEEISAPAPTSEPAGVETNLLAKFKK